MLHSRYDSILLQRVSFGAATLAGVISLGGLAFGALGAWPLWATGLAVVVPWIPVFVRDVASVYRQYQWLALFYVLVVTQTGHFLEHVAQMIQIHVLGLQGADARGIFGTLDIEWVHLTWNTWVIVAVLVLLSHFGVNPWLRLTAIRLAGTRWSMRTSSPSIFRRGWPGYLDCWPREAALRAGCR